MLILIASMMGGTLTKTIGKVDLDRKNALRAFPPPSCAKSSVGMHSNEAHRETFGTQNWNYDIRKANAVTQTCPYLSE